MVSSVMSLHLESVVAVREHFTIEVSVGRKAQQLV